MEKKIKELAFHIRTLNQALLSLEEILAEEFSVIVRDATIQRFEYTFELGWKIFLVPHGRQSVLPMMWVF